MKNKRTVIRGILTALYVGFILWITIFSRNPGSERIFKGPFWEIQVGYWGNIILNIILFIPLGFLLGDKKNFFCGIALSILIEAVQYIFKLGFCEVDDILNNSIGVIIGSLLYRLFERKKEELCTRYKK